MSRLRERITGKLGRFCRRHFARHLMLALALSFLVGAASDAAAVPKRVLLLHSLGQIGSPWSEFSARFTRQLVQRWPDAVDLYEITLFSERNSDVIDDAPLREYVVNLFARGAPDLIVPIGPPAVRFLQRNRASLFPASPVLHTAAGERFVSGAAPENETSVSIRTNWSALVQNSFELLPKTNYIAVVHGNSPIEQSRIELLRRVYAPYADRIELVWWNELSVEDMLKRAAAMPPNSAIHYYGVASDGAGVPQGSQRVLSLLRSVANAPIFGGVDINLGNGIVGGPLLSIQQLSDKATDVAIRILRGERPQDIRTPPIEAGVPTYDGRELKRWNISDASLPPGSVVLLREPTFWSQYRWTVVTVLAIVCAQAALIGLLLFERYRRQLAEAASRRRFIELTQINRSLAVSAMSSSIAHDLNQPLGAILNNTGAAQMLLTKDPPDILQVQEILADIRKDDERAGAIISHLRGFLKEGNLPLQDVDINRAIADVLHIVELEAAKRGIEIECLPAPQMLAVRADYVHLQQVLLNLALNGIDAMKNSANGRRMVFQTVRMADREVEVSVLDTGTGIPEQKLNEIFNSFVTTKQHGTGLGLSIARTIVEMYGGRIWAENRQGGGAAFRFVLPLARAAAA